METRPIDVHNDDVYARVLAFTKEFGHIIENRAEESMYLIKWWDSWKDARIMAIGSVAQEKGIVTDEDHWLEIMLLIDRDNRKWRTIFKYLK